MPRRTVSVPHPNGDPTSGNYGKKCPLESNGDPHAGAPEEKVELGKKVTLLRGISIIVGTIIGAGIFISPKGILKNSGSVGMSLVVWIACGILSLFGECVNMCICSHTLAHIHIIFSHTYYSVLKMT